MYHRVEQVCTAACIDIMWNVSRLEAFPGGIILE